MSDTEVENGVAPDGRKKNPYAVWFVVLSFILPVAAAYYMFYFGDIKSFSNNGEFLQPYYDIALLDLKKDGEVFNGETMDRKWHLMIVAGANCDETCRERLINVRQINRAVKRPPKLRHALILTSDVNESFDRFIKEEMQQATILRGDAEILSQHMDNEDPVSQIYLSDPLGNVIMRFSHELTPKLVIKDLNRLF